MTVYSKFARIFQYLSTSQEFNNIVYLAILLVITIKIKCKLY